MLLQNGRRNARLSSFMLDIVHIVIGCLIALLAVLAFWDPDRNKVLFPFIFLLGSVLYLITGINQARNCGRVRRRKVMAVTVVALGALLLVLAVLSAVSIWG